MPVVDVDPDELRRLTGHDEKDDEALKEDLFALGLEFEGETEDGLLQLEFAPDRLDRLSVEGVARSLRYQYGDDRGVYIPDTNDADWTIEVEGSVPDERPYVTGAVVRGLDLDEAGLESLIQLQEKLHATMGRKRAKGAIGVHDLTMLKGASATGASGGRKSIRYTGIEPDGETFVPLDSDRELTPGEVLTDHPTGETYAGLVADYERYPAIYDDVGLFSFPPVINGTRTEVETASRDLFIEMTGTDQWTIDRMLNIVCYALDARGGRVERVDIDYPDRTLDRPDLSTDRKTVGHDRIESLLGVSFDPGEVVDLLERAGLDAVAEEDGTLTYEVAVPPYRVDVLHPLDVVDDVGRAYGFNDLEPRYPDVGTIGGRHERSRIEDAARDALVGLGFEDMLNFHMTSEAENYERMGLDTPSAHDDEVTPDPDAPLGARPPVTITEPYSEDYTMVRSWALPSLTMVLERNTHRAYPQDLAEIGLAAHRDDGANTRVAERRTVAGVLARTDASYEDAKGKLQALCRVFDVDLSTPPTDHPSFIDGRTASIVIDGDEVGVIGELHPRVLVEHDLELPVAGFEFRLDALR
ncbi:phenylalanine--tRNA ligase subunit beta [Haloglomus irregulare]|jgi:phenylalanyl-tRNA synthetase beta chain|uniref:Phenylalanine--tRNA ligase beta subunit n=1 Tax=Haloglomus irregulare TaxID=2234134 RepID=A0A554NBB0_9EURY|nr:phenylalanine--tRNA ligase subunit beta [Haloglomus irregulare]TSD14672.1 phenylalanine--tRNA ligase subunit beta [Haloglomus irregulare]